MCGIAGHLAADARAPADVAAARAMAAALVHRGPDAEGVWADGPGVLAHRRLSILDLSEAGRQPLHGCRSDVAVVVNGEIYNYPALRRELESKGHRFRSSSDSEVVAHLYEDVGADFVRRIEGMFAIAVYDAAARRIVLARDRLGKKPLYYSVGPRGLYFASEAQALCAGLPAVPDPDLAAIDLYLTLQYVPSPRSALMGVRKLEPAHFAVAEPGLPVRPERYWALLFGTPAKRRWPLTTATVARELRCEVARAVEARLASDVPLGAFLSGGLDSSTIVAFMARAAGRVRTFTIRFPGDPPVDAAAARAVARRYSTEHIEEEVRPETAAILPELARRYGEPFADASALPTYFLSRAARAHVTVALSGDAGDEAFGGYSRYRWMRLTSAVARLPLPLRRIVARVGGALPWARARPVADFAAKLADGEAARYLALVGHIPPDVKRELYRPEIRRQVGGDGAPGDAALAYLAARFASSGATDDLNRWVDVDVRSYLPEAVLTKVDIASMAHALEVRAPLCDARLMEFAASLPGALKLRGTTGKWIFREAVRDLLPREVIELRKRGFDPPVSRWLRGELREMTHDLLARPDARIAAWLRPGAVTALIREHDAGIDRGLWLWTLLMLELWLRGRRGTPN